MRLEALKYLSTFFLQFQKVHVKEKDSGLKHNYIGHVNIVK
jgi:hypothetical protein